ncbi:ALP1-like protein [Tanacetum coccineum]
MNPNSNDEDEYVSEVDNESDIWFMTKAIELHEMMEQEERDTAHVALFIVNGVQYEKGYYLGDSIYLQWSTFVKSFMVEQDEKHAHFKRRQENARKDVERAFGAL